MFDLRKFKSSMFSITRTSFEKAALEAFRYQWEHNLVYREFCTSLSKNPSNVSHLHEIPFLPIDLFKTQDVVTGKWQEDRVFLSSGTSGQLRSRHFVKEESFYHEICLRHFEKRYGPLGELQILALLPSYLEQKDSSLISMINFFIQKAAEGSGFLLHEMNEVKERLRAKNKHQKLMIGVTYALLDLAESLSQPLENCIIMETGGMKGRRKEITRMELHEILKASFGVSTIHSEYGMTELLSQAYGSDGLFAFPEWCTVMIRDINDPFTYLSPGETGGINIIDLGNIHSCCFIETKDLGQIKPDKTGFFEVLGRFDNSDLRGCNLML